jgi:prepilin-type N-terminal cleavage/methylation domain-containing protein
MSREAKAKAGMQAHRPGTLHARLARRKGRRGFTAIEMAMVATVIAILALIVMPLFRNRVEEAKLAAAKADLESLMKSEILAQADTSFFFRLEDLDNVINNDPAIVPAAGITIETPPVIFYPPYTKDPRSLTLDEWHNLAGTKSTPKFKGPYCTFTHTAPYSEALVDYPYLFRSVNSGYSPIRDLRQGGYRPAGDPGVFSDAPNNRIPVDPWGNPYLFFPPTEETSYNYSAIYSLGPDGLPGDAGNGMGITAASYLRETGVLGTGDDLEVRF